MHDMVHVTLWSSFLPLCPTPQGVLRGIYLSPGGAKSHSPLSRFREVLFGLLGALPSSPSEADSRGGTGGAVLDGVVVRDVPAFLQVRFFLVTFFCRRAWIRRIGTIMGRCDIEPVLHPCHLLNG